MHDPRPAEQAWFFGDGCRRDTDTRSVEWSPPVPSVNHDPETTRFKPGPITLEQAAQYRYTTAPDRRSFPIDPILESSPRGEP